MSMVVRTPEGTLELYCKGADDVVFSRLAGKEKYLDRLAHHLRFFGVHGLRTLVFAKVSKCLFAWRFNISKTVCFRPC